MLITIQYLVIVSTANQKTSNDSTALTSSPIISGIPENTYFRWGQENASLSWEVFGGELWKLWKNDTQIRNGTVIDDKIEIKIENWQLEDWRLGAYNLTLQVSNENDNSIISTIWVQIIFGDEYANSDVFSDSPFYNNEDRAIGAPDGKFALIYDDYAPGALILDMGMGEEIIDGNGKDMTIVAQGGNYSVKVTNDLSTPFTYLEFNREGNNSFDLAEKELAIARYVCVEYFGGSSVELDAIVAIHYNQEDVAPPQIIEPSDFWIWSNQTTIALAWEVFDVTPWNYDIIVDEVVFEEGSWNGSKITFTLNLAGNNSEVNTTLILYDLFGNNAKDTVIIEIRPVTTSSETKTTPYYILSLFMGFSVLLIMYRYNAREK
jgi:hypothetical protein